LQRSQVQILRWAVFVLDAGLLRYITLTAAQEAMLASNVISTDRAASGACHLPELESQMPAARWPDGSGAPRHPSLVETSQQT
jgi:hypothetical protein